MKKNSIWLISLLFGFLIIGCVNKAPERPFSELIYIDHQNLRYIEDQETVNKQLTIIKENLDQAANQGIDTYLFFAKETFEAMLHYDFEIDGPGNIGEKAFNGDQDHYTRAKYLRSALKEAIEYGNQKNIGIFFHSNQFIFPDEVLEVIKPATWGTAVCPGREATWQIYSNKMQEFLEAFPGLAGFQITGDETQVSVLECQCDSCAHLSFVDRVNLLTTETAEVCQVLNKKVQMRTWQRMGELEEEKHPSRMGEGIPSNVYFSIKNTDGDFRSVHPVDEKFLKAADPKRVIVEFDAWREYDGNNYFPCYMGEIWSPRFKMIKNLGIQRIAVRLNWNSNKNQIFETPWGNTINLYAFNALAANPELNGDEVLKSFVQQYYPSSAQQAAVELYQFSPEFLQVIYYLDDEYLANHSRVQDDDAAENLKDAQEKGRLTRPEDFVSRAQEINSACEKANLLIDKLGPDVNPVWINSLNQGVQILQHIALGTLDKFEAIYWKQQQNQQNLDEVMQRLSDRQKQWKAFHPESYESMNGADLTRDIL